MGLGINLVAALHEAMGRGGGVEYVEVDPIRRLVVRVGDDGVHVFVARGGNAVEVKLSATL